MRVNWKARRKEIPHRVQIGKTWYEIVWVSDFADGKTLGETRFNPPQIALISGLTDKLTVSVYGHEVIHAISEEFKAGLTENQVLALEQAIPSILKPQNLFVTKK